MTFDLDKILESKRALRRDLALRPIAEKLRMLDALRERTLAIRSATIVPGAEKFDVNEASASYGDPDCCLGVRPDRKCVGRFFLRKKKRPTPQRRTD